MLILSIKLYNNDCFMYSIIRNTTTYVWNIRKFKKVTIIMINKNKFPNTNQDIKQEYVKEGYNKLNFFNNIISKEELQQFLKNPTVDLMIRYSDNPQKSGEQINKQFSNIFSQEYTTSSKIENLMVTINNKSYIFSGTINKDFEITGKFEECTINNKELINSNNVFKGQRFFTGIINENNTLFGKMTHSNGGNSYEFTGTFDGKGNPLSGEGKIHYNTKTERTDNKSNIFWQDVERIFEGTIKDSVYTGIITDNNTDGEIKYNFVGKINSYGQIINLTKREIIFGAEIKKVFVNEYLESGNVNKSRLFTENHHHT